MTKHDNRTNKILLILLIGLTISMVAQPSLAYQSATRGLELWWTVVTPALLPFFFISELLMEMNISRYLSYAMSPLMRPLFNLPGCAALAVALGFCSGFPSGASITASLRRKNEITRAEGERMICFTNNAGPLYISVAVAGGLLHCPKAAIILAIVHYGGNLLIGILLGLGARKRKRSERQKEIVSAPAAASESIGNHDIGRILKAAVSHAAANIITIGCLMIFFSVISGNISALNLPGTPQIQAFFQGFWEMSLGVNVLADSSLSLQQIIPVAAAILGFGGISVQMQVLAMVGDTDIRIFPYLACRIGHAVFSYLAATLLCSWISLPVSAITITTGEINFFLSSLQLCCGALAILAGISLVLIAIRPLYLYHHKS